MIGDRLGGKKTCKYYNACGNVENCLHCAGYAKEVKKNDNKRNGRRIRFESENDQKMD